MIWAGEATALAAFLRNQPRAAMAADIQICTHRPIRTTRDDHVAAVELQRDERTRLRYLIRMRRHHRRAFNDNGAFALCGFHANLDRKIVFEKTSHTLNRVSGTVLDT